MELGRRGRSDRCGRCIRFRAAASSQRTADRLGAFTDRGQKRCCGRPVRMPVTARAARPSNGAIESSRRQIDARQLTNGRLKGRVCGRGFGPICPDEKQPRGSVTPRSRRETPAWSDQPSGCPPARTIAPHRCRAEGYPQAARTPFAWASPGSFAGNHLRGATDLGMIRARTDGSGPTRASASWSPSWPR